MLSPHDKVERMLASQNCLSDIGACIEMFEAGGEWCVRVVENGGEQVSCFVIESFATAFAEGQRIRLGLDSITRL